MLLMHAPARWRRSFHGIGVEGITEEHVQNELRAGKGYFYKVQEERERVEDERDKERSAMRGRRRETRDVRRETRDDERETRHEKISRQCSSSAF